MQRFRKFIPLIVLSLSLFCASTTFAARQSDDVRGKRQVGRPIPCATEAEADAAFDQGHNQGYWCFYSVIDLLGERQFSVTYYE